MATSLTLFKSQFDNRTARRMDFSSFDELEKLLYALSKRPLPDKRSAPLISPAVYVTDEDSDSFPDSIKEPSNKYPDPYYHRKNKNVTSWAGWCAVDVDDIEIDGDIESFVRKLVPDWRFVCYSTASSTKEKPKFRIVLELPRALTTDEIKHFWFALQSYLDEAGDKQCKDLSRMYFIPATYKNAYNFIFSGTGAAIDIQKLLTAYPYIQKNTSNNFMDRLPGDIQAQVIQHRKDQQNNTTYRWYNYRDCPFWPQNLAREYTAIAGSGWYHKMYQIMVATASRAVEKGYPITSNEIAALCKEFDVENGNWYENRPLNVEADRAIEYVYKNG